MREKYTRQNSNNVLMYICKYIIIMSEKINRPTPIEASERSNITGSEARKTRKLTKELSHPSRVHRLGHFLVDSIALMGPLAKPVSRDYETIYKKPGNEPGKIIIKRGVYKRPYRGDMGIDGSSGIRKVRNMEVDITTPLAEKSVLGKNFQLLHIRRFTDTNEGIHENDAVGLETDDGVITTIGDENGVVNESGLAGVLDQVGVVRVHGVEKFLDEATRDLQAQHNLNQTNGLQPSLIDILEAINMQNDFVSTNATRE